MITGKLMNKESFPDFSGKTISMSVIDDSHSHDLDKPYFEYQGGRLFIIGIVPEIASGSGWNGNNIGAVAWDRVDSYSLFSDLKTYIQAVKKSESHNDDQGSKDS